MTSRLILTTLRARWASDTTCAITRRSSSSFANGQHESDDAQEERVQWLKKFDIYMKGNASELPKDWISTSFSRSSGPGGQNVNKLNTKAEVRLDLSSASKDHFDAPTMPKEVMRYLSSNSPYYTASSHSLLVTSMRTRSQAGNLQDALNKVQTHLISILSQGIRGETSIQQKQKVKSLIARDKARTRSTKERRGSVKSARRVSKGSIDF